MGFHSDSHPSKQHVGCNSFDIVCVSVCVPVCGFTQGTLYTTTTVLCREKIREITVKKKSGQSEGKFKL